MKQREEIERILREHKAELVVWGPSSVVRRL